MEKKMAKTVNRIFASEIVRKARSAERSYFGIEPKADEVVFFGSGESITFQTLSGWAEVFEHSTRKSTWISTSAKGAERLVQEATARSFNSGRGSKVNLGDLLALESPATKSLPALGTVFHRVIGQVPGFRWLPQDELFEVLFETPKEKSRDLFIGGLYDPATETLTLTRGNLETIVVPVSLFRPSEDAKPDPSKFAVIDYGQTIRLGRYEAAADAILYEVNPEYRKRIKSKRREEDKGFGPSLRRLRIQRGLRRSDFPGITSKTIARIERGEISKPHGNTLSVLANTLGVSPAEIETY
jgi:hypothetical protein